MTLKNGLKKITLVIIESSTTKVSVPPLIRRLWNISKLFRLINLILNILVKKMTGP